MSDVHVIGAGLAGLSCATSLAEAGIPVTLYEAAPYPGGRCRSLSERFHGRVIDNGNHLVLGANPQTFGYLDRIGGRAYLSEVVPAALPFVDLTDGQRWCLRPGAGMVPIWLFDRHRRVADASLFSHLHLLRLALARGGATVAECLPLSSVMGRRLWHPLTVSILNTAPEQADAGLLWQVLRRTLLAGGAACRPWLAPHGLSKALIDPALRYLDKCRTPLQLGNRLVRLDHVDRRITALTFKDGHTLTVGSEATVVLALPAWVTAELLPGLKVPEMHNPIVNAHFLIPPEVTGADTLPPILGLVGGMAEWVFVRDGIASITISAADKVMTIPEPALITGLWRDVTKALNLADSHPPPYRLIKERRATFAATPDANACRPSAQSRFQNLFLAGDWTDTGLPATIEGAIQSGHLAASLVQALNRN